MKARRPFVLLLACAACHHDPEPAAAPRAAPLPLLAAAAPRSVPEPPPGSRERSATAILGAILRDNAGFARTHDRRYFARFREHQHPRATVVACADSRFHENALELNPDDDLFVIRNIGNQVDSTPGSVQYGILHLHTPLLLIVGHVKCGAVEAAMGDYGDEPATIRRELDGLHLSIFRAKARGTKQERWLASVVSNVHQQVRDALHEYRDDVKSGKLTVVGAVYDFSNELGHGAGRLVLANVNGETDPARIEASPLVQGAKRIAGLPRAAVLGSPPAPPRSTPAR